MSERVLVDITDGVADVRMNRPDKINALDPAMFGALADAARRLADDASVRAVVLSGEGRGFCAGLDFSSFQAMAGDADAPRDESAGDPSFIGAVPDGKITHGAQWVADAWRTMPAPVIAAVHGVALGGGCQIALGADLRVVAPDARLSMLEIRWGLSPDMTGTQRLIELVGLDRAKELVFTGRMVEGTEAHHLGLATTVAQEPHRAALELAAEIAANSPHAVRAAKRLLNEAARRTLADGYRAEREEIGRLIGSPNQVEAVTAYFEQRPPDFADPE